MRIAPASDSALFISFGDSISLETHRRVISLLRVVERLRNPHIRNLHPAYTSLVIDFDPLQLKLGWRNVAIRSLTGGGAFSGRFESYEERFF